MGILMTPLIGNLNMIVEHNSHVLYPSSQQQVETTIGGTSLRPMFFGHSGRATRCGTLFGYSPFPYQGLFTRCYRDRGVFLPFLILMAVRIMSDTFNDDDKKVSHTPTPSISKPIMSSWFAIRPRSVADLCYCIILFLGFSPM